MTLLCMLTIVAIQAVAVRAQTSNEMSLAGEWHFALDRNNTGETDRLFARELPDHARLPGSMHEQGLGDPPSAQTKWTAQIGVQFLNNAPWNQYAKEGDFKTPFWLTPLRYYVGPAWYQREVEIPASWSNKRIVLMLERPHWETVVWVDDKLMGMQNSLGVPHEYDLSEAMTPGKHRLTIRVDNTVKIPSRLSGHTLDAHAISDQTQGNWNGIVGAIKLTATDKVWIDDAQVYPNLGNKTARIQLSIGNLTGVGGEGMLTVSARTLSDAQQPTSAPAKDFAVTWGASGGKAEIEYALGDSARPWDEFSPALVKMNLSLKSSGGINDARAVTFGMREFTTKGTQFVINGRPIMLRGTLECCIFPLTGYPPTDVASWKKVISTAKSYGLNHLRFHSWCPPEEAFEAADELGMYLHIEASAWTSYERPEMLPWITAEIDRMLRAYGNHPSFIMLAPSNEPNRNDPQGVMTNLMTTLASKDSRHLYTAGGGWPQLPGNQYHILSAPRMNASGELRRPPQTTSDYSNEVSQYTIPIVGHEIGQWSAFPNLEEPAKYTGSMKATNLEIFKDILTRSGLGDQAKDFLLASGHLQALLYKEEIENHLRTPGIGGFQLLDLHDFPGQGTAPVGVLDAFWDSKGYITPQQHARYCGPTVPLARMAKRIFTTDEEFAADVEVAHFGPIDLQNVNVSWNVKDSAGKLIQQGSFSPAVLKTGGQTKFGSITIAKGTLPAPAKLRLEIALDQANAANDWDFWVYLESVSVDPSADVRVVNAMDDVAMKYLTDGGKLLLVPPPANISGNTVPSFGPLFWNNITFPGGNRVHTLGILCDPKNPALAKFPTEFHSNWQWWELAATAKPIVLTNMPRELKPLVQSIDDWLTCRKLGLIFEAKVGNGKLIMSSIDLAQNLDSRLVARQLRRSILDYMASEAFAPTVALSPDQVRSLFR
ncbi:MAG TPA: hypothetical protein VHD56_16050 [Tepidisphaeraceae bacterium]|nr:hypothetical protein [Tepidisphaeraceae bacterium]